MTPTLKLRFVERVVPSPEYGEGVGKKVRVLQQWWEKQYLEIVDGPLGSQLAPIEGEWRDVPLEKE